MRRRKIDGSDLLVVGAGIIGLAHALAGARAGLSVTVLDRDAQANGASIRNFGFVTVTGQEEGATWRRARRSRDLWAELAPAAGIEVRHRGLLLACRRPQALAVAEEFCDSPMGEGCQVLDRSDLAAHAALRNDLLGALYSPHELRVESRDAIPRLAAYLGQQHGVRFHRRTAVHAVEPGRVHTTAGTFAAPNIVVCPGPDIVTLFPDIFAKHETTLCKLHMMRVASPGWRLPAAVMSDLGLHRYLGYASCPSLPALRARLKAEQAQELADGVHLIVVQGADGSLVVGDSHHYGPTPDPFQPASVDALILRELRAVLDIPEPKVVERWTGLYSSGPQTAFVETPMEGVRLVSVTSGTGASTGFGLAEEVMADLLGNAVPSWVSQEAAA
jgi:FAD dependent oxidoreductase TIGR03364